MPSELEILESLDDFFAGLVLKADFKGVKGGVGVDFVGHFRVLLFRLLIRAAGAVPSASVYPL
jgi:hypothetical protein